MTGSQIYIAVTIVVLAVIAILMLVVNRNRKANYLTPLGGLAFGFILAGTVIRDDRLVGYGLMGVGVLLAIIDAVRKSKTGQITVVR